MTAVLERSFTSSNLRSTSAYGLAVSVAWLLMPASGAVAVQSHEYLSHTGTKTPIVVAQPVSHSASTTAVPGGVQSTRDRVEQLRTLSGLTTDQVARLMGVSRRSVHNWLGGGPMAAGNEERLAQLLDVMHRIPGSAQDRRARLLDSSAGRSLFHRLLDEHSEPATIQGSPLTIRDRMAL